MDGNLGEFLKMNLFLKQYLFAKHINTVGKAIDGIQLIYHQVSLLDIYFFLLTR